MAKVLSFIMVIALLLVNTYANVYDVSLSETMQDVQAKVGDWEEAMYVDDHVNADTESYIMNEQDKNAGETFNKSFVLTNESTDADDEMEYVDDLNEEMLNENGASLVETNDMFINKLFGGGKNDNQQQQTTSTTEPKQDKVGGFLTRLTSKVTNTIDKVQSKVNIGADKLKNTVTKVSNKLQDINTKIRTSGVGRFITNLFRRRSRTSNAAVPQQQQQQQYQMPKPPVRFHILKPANRKPKLSISGLFSKFKDLIGKKNDSKREARLKRAEERKKRREERKRKRQEKKEQLAKEKEETKNKIKDLLSQLKLKRRPYRNPLKRFINSAIKDRIFQGVRGAYQESVVKDLFKQLADEKALESRISGYQLEDVNTVRGKINNYDMHGKRYGKDPFYVHHAQHVPKKISPQIPHSHEAKGHFDLDQQQQQQEIVHFDDQQQQQDQQVTFNEPTQQFEEPTKQIEDPTKQIEDPTKQIEDPTKQVEDPTQQITGNVENNEPIKSSPKGQEQFNANENIEAMSVPQEEINGENNVANEGVTNAEFNNGEVNNEGINNNEFAFVEHEDLVDEEEEFYDEME